MGLSMGIPESIKSRRPTRFGAVEIRFIGGHYYTYLVSSKWDAAKGRPQKVTGKSIGKITEADGFIPNANGLSLMQEMRLMPDVAPSVKNYGAYEVLQQLTPDLSDSLREYFPDSFREIRTLSLIRLVDKISSAKMIQPLFLDSYMSDICGGHLDIGRLRPEVHCQSWFETGQNRRVHEILGYAGNNTPF